ncbi:hypothetical protein V8G54_005331 [Vigna mungo]|uniref:Uncharacterized protein n=1 Tax=Vigna mungo TaxID=3915 RepID=A0AAQ3S3M7_VIGMU
MCRILSTWSKFLNKSTKLTSDLYHRSTQQWKRCLGNAMEWVEDDRRKQKCVEGTLKRCLVAGLDKIDGEIEAQFQTVVFCELGSEMEAEIWVLKCDADGLKETLKLSLGDLQQKESSGQKSTESILHSNQRSLESDEAFLKLLVAHERSWMHMEDHNWC